MKSLFVLLIVILTILIYPVMGFTETLQEEAARQTIILTLGTPTGAILGASTQHTVTIVSAALGGGKDASGL